MLLQGVKTDTHKAMEVGGINCNTTTVESTILLNQINIWLKFACVLIQQQHQTLNFEYCKHFSILKISMSIYQVQ